MVCQTKDLGINPAEPDVMHIDINSCFASVEQQANPLLRGKSVAVAAYTSGGGCILAASIEAKQLGVKTGLRVREGKVLCPNLVVLPTDPEKYRQIHLKMKKVLADYSDRLTPKSIDEFVLDFGERNWSMQKIVEVGKEIKARIKTEVGDWIRVSIGIGTNRFLAKMASNIKKPDGLFVIGRQNLEEVYRQLNLEDLYGINKANKLRLMSVGIMTPLQFLAAEIKQIKAAFKSVLAYDWYVRLRGWEIDDVNFKRASFGQSYALAKPCLKKDDLRLILIKLTEKMGQRMREGGFEAGGVSLAIFYRDSNFWHLSKKLEESVFGNREIVRKIFYLLNQCPFEKTVGKLMISVFDLKKRNTTQLALFESVLKTGQLADAVDEINHWWGDWTIASAAIDREKQVVADRISFGIF